VVDRLPRVLLHADGVGVEALLREDRVVLQVPD
jgi:hypothetical protein